MHIYANVCPQATRRQLVGVRSLYCVGPGTKSKKVYRLGGDCLFWLIKPRVFFIHYIMHIPIRETALILEGL